jgi:hypothetical protein
LQGPDTDTAVLERLTGDMAASRVFEGKATNYRKDGTPFTMWWRSRHPAGLRLTALRDAQLDLDDRA